MQCWWPGGDATPSDGRIFQGWWYRDQLPPPNGWMEKYEDAALCVCSYWLTLNHYYFYYVECMTADLSDAWAQQLLWDFITCEAPVTFKCYFWSGCGFPLRMTHILILASKHIQTGWDPSTFGQWGLWSRMWGIWETDVCGSYFDYAHKHGHKQAGGVTHFGTWLRIRLLQMPLGRLWFFLALNEKILEKKHT